MYASGRSSRGGIARRRRARSVSEYFLSLPSSLFFPGKRAHVYYPCFSDYYGARRTGLQALLLRRPGESNDTRLRDDKDAGKEVLQVRGLEEVLGFVEDSTEKSNGSSDSGRDPDHRGDNP